MLRFIVHCIRLVPSNERPNKKKHFQKRLHCVVFRCACMFSLRCSYFCSQIKSTSVSATCCLSSYHGVKYKKSEKDAESTLTRVRQGKRDIYRRIEKDGEGQTKKQHKQKNSQNYLKHTTFGLFSVTIKCICELLQWLQFTATKHMHMLHRIKKSSIIESAQIETDLFNI